MSKLGKKLIAAAQEGVAIARGDAAPGSFTTYVPADDETDHLLRSPANADRLFESIEQANHGDLTAHELIVPRTNK